MLFILIKLVKWIGRNNVSYFYFLSLHKSYKESLPTYSSLKSILFLFIKSSMAPLKYILIKFIQFEGMDIT